MTESPSLTGILRLPHMNIYRESPISNYGLIITAEADDHFVLANTDGTLRDFSAYADKDLLLGLYRKRGESWDWEEYTPDLKDGKHIQVNMMKSDKISLETMSLITTKED